jgi:hypothetical protein
MINQLEEMINMVQVDLSQDSQDSQEDLQVNHLEM